MSNKSSHRKFKIFTFNIFSMKIIITGGAGFVGKNLIRLMLKNKFKPKDIIVIDKDRNALNFIKKFGVNTVYADLSKRGKWENSFKNVDIIISLAAQISSENYIDFKKNNVDAIKNVVLAAKKYNVKKIIHFSSAAVLSVRMDPYAKTKKEGEKIIFDSQLTYSIIRPSVMYGPYDDKNIGWFINFARTLPIFPIPGNGKYPRQPVYVDDVCAIVIKMIRKMPKNKIYSINGKEIVYFDKIVDTIYENLDKFRTKIYIPLPIFKFAVIMYKKIFPNFKFTSDQLDSLVSGDIFPDYPWWDEFKIKPTKFSDGVRNMFIAGVPKIKTIL